MTNTRNLVLSLMIISTLFINKSAASEIAIQCQSLSSLQWMLGQWHEKSSNTHVTETWLQISDNTIEGIGETTILNKNNKKLTETLRIVKMGDAIFYLAKVSSNPLPVAFKLIECSDSIAVFTNEQHDFPQKLSYKKVSENQLTVQVSSKENDGFELLFTRVE